MLRSRSPEGKEGASRGGTWSGAAGPLLLWVALLFLHRGMSCGSEQGESGGRGEVPHGESQIFAMRGLGAGHVPQKYQCPCSRPPSRLLPSLPFAFVSSLLVF